MINLFVFLTGIAIMTFSFYKMHEVEVNFEQTLRAGAPWYYIR